MSNSPGLWFVYRAQHEGPLCKRVRRLEAPSILTWFQWQLDEARTSASPATVAQAQLGGPVPALSRLFHATQDHALHTPRTMPALRSMLRGQLYAGQGEDRVLADAHTLRFLAPDGDGSGMVCFFDDEAARSNPSCFAYLLHEEGALPDGESDQRFASPGELPVLSTGRHDASAIFSIGLTNPGAAVPGHAVCLPGLALPDLADYLQELAPTGPKELAAWPLELRILRALVEDDDTGIEPALLRVTHYPLANALRHASPELGTGPLPEARGEVKALAAKMAVSPPTTATVSHTAHAALLCLPDEEHGTQQWFLFDTCWAAAHADLASSILRSALSWDPCAKLKPPHAPKPPPAPKAPKPPKPPRQAHSASSPARASTGTRSTKAEKQSDARQHSAWLSGLAGRTASQAIPYRPTLRFAEGELINHPTFGLGFVSRADPTKCEVVFETATRLLIHAVGV